MPEDEELGADLGSLIQRPGTVEKSRDEQRTSVASAMGDRLGLRAVSSRDREQAVRLLAANLTAALAQFLLDAERQVLNRAESVRASTLADIERQRANVESLIGMFA